MTDAELEQLARRMALDELNINRAEVGLPRLHSLSALWWEMNAQHWRQLARERDPGHGNYPSPFTHGD